MNEVQFDTETHLKEETEPVSEICFTPGNPFFLKAGVKLNFLNQNPKYPVLSDSKKIIRKCKATFG